jgi:2-keto-4-pentenoate hydratase
MALSEDLIQQISDQLLDAERTCQPIDPITEKFKDLSYQDVYSVQLRSIRKKVQSGAVVVGKKIGLTSKGMQAQFHIDEPDYGIIVDKAVFREGKPFPTKQLILPRIEAEIAFLLRDTLKGPGITLANVLKATEGVIPAFEVIDSRIRDWKITVKDSIADNASNAAVILGGKITPISDIDLRLTGLVLEKNGEMIATAAGAEVLGNPAQSVAWLANKLSEYDIALQSGEFIMSGSLTRAANVEPGSFFRATFDRLGPVSVLFE